MKLIRVTIYLISLTLVGIAAYQAGYTAQKPIVIIDRAPAAVATPEPVMQYESIYPFDQDHEVVIVPPTKRYHSTSCDVFTAGGVVKLSKAKKLGYTACLVCGG